MGTGAQYEKGVISEISGANSLLYKMGRLDVLN
jgi:hypothetical protein